jgi:hypothetical protein
MILGNSRYQQLIILSILIFIVCLYFSSTLVGSDRFKIIPVGYVSASFPVNFSLFSSEKKQYIAFYDTIHELTLACRELHTLTWDTSKLDSKVGWDGHNYLSMIVDNDGYIHLAGNMHSSHLKYFRSSIPFDIHSMQVIDTMTGKDEDITTYPEFMNGPNKEIIFHYRSGRSGSGYEIFNLWNANERRWKRLLDTSLTDGCGHMNAYAQGPLLGPDGFYHLL